MTEPGKQVVSAKCFSKFLNNIQRNYTKYLNNNTQIYKGLNNIQIYEVLNIQTSKVLKQHTNIQSIQSTSLIIKE